ncbi:MAG: UTP--glucose-1-phosphate uridylyltransferase [Dermatophilaceae bacterium]
MSDDGLRQAREKMHAAEVDTTAIEVFSRYYRELEAGATGLVRESSIEPLIAPADVSQATVGEVDARRALSRTAVIKLNGGLGTSMGMEQAKSLLPVRDQRTFLDVIVAQVRHARQAYDVTLPLMLMNSFRTRQDTLSALARHPDVAVEGLPLDFLQNQEPKLLAQDLTPVHWPADPTLEWCPPGHGDLYTSLFGSGLLQRLVDEGYHYAFVSNSDNLGATPDPILAGWFAASGAPYAAEVCLRTPADRKGGHLAVRRSDGRLILRDTAQTAPEDMHYFTDEHRHPYVHTNNLWFDLRELHRILCERNGVLELPLIRNVKPVDPSDPSSPEVIQVESAMGAAIEVFEGAQALGVPRERFLPVKTTDDLLLVRSDVYDVGADGALRMVIDTAPQVRLDRAHYTRIGDFDARFPAGVPSLRGARSLTVRGDWTFGADVVVAGHVELQDLGTPQHVPDHARLDGAPRP